jgi:DNA-directed RNA polymerase subunit H (RpoH/RPB5)
MEDILLEKLWPIYKNVIGMLLDRGYKITKKIQNKKEFKKIFLNQMIWIESYINDTDKCMVYISKFIKTFTMSITEKALSYIKDISNIKKVIMIIDTKSRVKKRKGYPYEIEFIKQDYFIFRITEHVLVNKHRLLSDEEKNNFYKNSTFKEKNMPRITINDPISIHFGAKEGDVFEIERKSKFGILSELYYRKVIL